MLVSHRILELLVEKQESFPSPTNDQMISRLVNKIGTEITEIESNQKVLHVINDSPYTVEIIEKISNSNVYDQYFLIQEGPKKYITCDHLANTITYNFSNLQDRKYRDDFISCLGLFDVIVFQYLYEGWKSIIAHNWIPDHVEIAWAPWGGDLCSCRR